MAWAVLAAMFGAASGVALFGWLERERKVKQVRDAWGIEPAASGPEPVAGQSGGVRSGPFARKRLETQRKRRTQQADVHVAEMIDSISLGMRAGLSFDRAFGLYCTRFDDVLAQRCREAMLSWESGLVDRAQALHNLERDFDLPILSRFVDNVLRALKYGSPLGRVLDELAGEARAEYRSRREEAVAKAPVKMMVPTAALILPAMLILVMGPVLLDFL